MTSNYMLAILAGGDANDNTAYIPEWWAQETLAILLEEMVVANLVHRDFEAQLRSFGDVVNTRRPGEFIAKRKTDADDITLQDVVAENVRVPLDQHIHTSFILKDGEMSKSFKDLINEYVRPAAQSLARKIDKVVLGQVHQFRANAAGKLNGLDSTNAVDYLLELREVMNINKAYTAGRRLIVSPQVETEMLKNDKFTSAERVGDEGTALREAHLGRKLGFDIFMGQNVNAISDLTTDIVQGTLGANYAAGNAGSMTVLVEGYEAVVGEYVVIEGNDQPQVITAKTASTDTTAITCANDPLKYAVESGDKVTIYKAADIDGNYSQGWSKPILLDGYASGKAPQAGQLVAFGTGSSRHVYTILDVTTESSTSAWVELDRPLVASLSNGGKAFPGPSGSMCPAFHRNALALVVRPLAAPRSQSGVESAVLNDGGISIRVTIQYNSIKQGHVVTLDLLCGVAVLDEKLGAVLYG